MMVYVIGRLWAEDEFPVYKKQRETSFMLSAI